MLPNPALFGLFLSAAIVLALTPGPGMLYVLTRSLRGGRAEGLASSLGTAIGGLGHVVAAGLGLSAVLATSALAFALVKYAGAVYLIYLGVQTLRGQHDLQLDGTSPALAGPAPHRALAQGIVTELLNPKTALFFLAFLPQFIDPRGPALGQFLLLGTISVTLNTTADVLVATFAGPLGQWLRRSARWQCWQRRFTGTVLIGLGVYVAVGDGGHAAPQP